MKKAQGERGSVLQRATAQAPRRDWIAPALTKIEAGSAENGAGPTDDDGTNFS